MTTLADIRAAAERLANAHNDTTACAALMQAEIKSAIGPIFDKYRATLDQYSSAKAAAQIALDALLAASPQLFDKPRSISVDGVKAGYRKAEDSMDWDDEAVVIKRIEALLPEQVDLLIRTAQSLNIEAIAALDAETRRKVGIRTVIGADTHFIKIGDNDVESLTKMVIAAAASRQGEEEKPKAKTGKAKLKVAA